MYLTSDSLRSRMDHFIVTATLGQKVLECLIIDNLLFSDHVPLKIRLDLNVDHMFERNYCHGLSWHEASTEQIDQYKSECNCSVRTIRVKNILMIY